MSKCEGCGKLGRMVPRDGSLERFIVIMDNIACGKVPPAPAVRKAKKKQVKDELDRIKQAEKKKRRLEKALATSAAIISELEKKKQKKKEEQQRLDEEGAAIAEKVALHVLLGEDSDDSCKAMLKSDERLKPWDCTSNINLCMGGRWASLPDQDFTKCSFEGIGWISNAYGSGCKWKGLGNDDWSLSSIPSERDLHRPSYFADGGWEATDFSAGFIAARAVSSLRIAEDAHVDAIVFNGVLRG
ncbi:hypothetical protein RJ641_033827 [Dillenia turbinata]|uniref:Uncharacterized protein n=1 Tax=Dillenia turbinata TaxID=194707 RepID=A0AAN8ZGE9_9MAGN